MALTFTKASTEYLDSTSTPVTAPPFSVSIWGRFTTAHTSDGEYETLWSINNVGSPDDYFKCQRDHDAANLIFVVTGVGGSADVAQTTNSITVDQWGNGICTTASATDRKVYWDNAGGGTATASRIPPGIDSWAIGAERDSTPDDYMQGKIAEIAVWNRVITATEWAGLAAGFSALFYPRGLVRYIPMFGNTTGPEQCWVSTDGLIHRNTPTLSANHPRIIYPSSPIFIPVAAGAPPSGRIMSSLARHGGLAGYGGIAGKGGGLAA